MTLNLAIHQAASRTSRSVAHTRKVMELAAAIILENRMREIKAEMKKLRKRK